MRYSRLRSLLVLSVASFATAFPFNGRSNELAQRWASKPNVSAAYYPQWHADELPLDQVPWNKYTNIYWAFLSTRPDPSDTSLSDSDSQLLKSFVQRAHDEGVLASMSVGGWDQSRYFSTNVGDEANRTAYADALLKFVGQYDLDGLDFNWINPNAQGIGCNTISPDDTDNFLKFLQLLREKAGESLLLTAAVTLTPFNDASGKPSKDVSKFADVLDWIQIEAYDISGPWSPAVGANGALFDECQPQQYREGSGDSAVKAWFGAGFPKKQIVLGCPTFGHSFSVNRGDAIQNGQLVPYPPFDASKHPRGDEYSDEGGRNVCGTTDPPGDTWNFRSLIKDGLLQENGEAVPGVPYRFDDCTKTAYVYRYASDVEISYDAPETYAEKGKFILDQELLGFYMWESFGDPNQILLDAIRESAGFNQQ